MIKIFAFSVAILLITETLNAQCRRNEIGIGVGIFQMYHGIGSSNFSNPKEYINQLSKINPRSVGYTQKKSSRSLPAIYYGYKVSKNVKLRTSLNIYQEQRKLGNMDCFVGGSTREYDAKFNQIRIATGLSKNLTNCSCMKTYMNADIVHYFEFANEKIVQNRYYETGVNLNENFNNKSTTYSIGFNPSFGIRKALCHGMSFSYEAGAEIKYNTGTYKSVNFICTPLNRLSLNYSF